MRTVLLTISLLLATTVFAALEWAPAPENYKLLPGGAIEISDGGGSTSDLYLLTAQDYRDFVLDFDLIAGSPGGGKVRAIVVWATEDANRANRKAFFLPTDRLQPGQRAHLRLTVAGERSVLSLDGTPIGTSPVTYGTPPSAGRVGLLHYYNYSFRYENVTLTPLEAASLPAPQKLQGRPDKSGVCALRWEMPEAYGECLTYQVYRAAGAAPALEPANRLATVHEPQFRDRTVRSRTKYYYTVVPAFGETPGPRVATAIVQTGALPPARAPMQVSAVRRLDGQVRLRWLLGADSRVQSLNLYRAASEAEAKSAGQLVASGLAVASTSYLAAAGTGDWYAVAVVSPDGGPPKRAVCQATASAPESRPGAGIPDKHPYLQYSTQQLERARQALQANDEGRKLAASLRASADSYASRPAAVPTEVTDEMGAVTSRMRQMGLYYQLLGDEKYARWVRDALVAYAGLYATLPDRGRRVKISKTVSGLYEAVWYVPLILSYDLVYESPAFTPEDHKLIERDLLRPAAELFWVRDYADPRDGRPGDLHYKCYNFQAWFISAVGLTGLMLRDADMVEHALDGPYGFKHLLAHDVHDDGLFWERSAGYHSFVIQALFPLLEAAHHCNLDLYKLQVPDEHNTDREPLVNYCVGDGDNGPKSMKLMFDGPFYYTFPDYTWPVVADSSRGPLVADTPYRAAWEHYRDPKYAWLINRGRNVTVPKRGELDAEGTVRLAYDSENLHVTAHILDQVVRNSFDKPDQVWQGDLLWFGLKWRPQPGGPYDVIYGLSPGDGDKVAPVAVVFDRFGKTVGEVSAAKYVVARYAKGYMLEAAIPLSELAPKAGEPGTPFVPRDGQKLAAEFVIYDCDAKSGPTTKEKMISWACQTDRYDSAQGGEALVGATPSSARPGINIPRAQGLVVDGRDTDWEKVGAGYAQFTPGSTVMTDASSAGLNLDDLLYERPVETGGFALTDGKFCNNGVVANRCSLFPSTGFALLRGTPFSVNLTYGPYGGGHGHPDKLSLVVWDNNKHLLPDFGSCKYESTEKAQWTAHTISHNTLTVDGRSQHPAGETDQGWPCDSFDKRSWGKLDFLYTTPTIKVVQAHAEGLFPGVKLTRTVALVGNKLIDVYRVDSKEKHVYDYALHVDETLAKASVALSPLADPLGSKSGYQHIHRAQGSAATSEGIQTEWGTADAPLAIAAAGGEPTQLITAESITNALDKFMPMVILRREATSTTFATCLTRFLPPPHVTVNSDGRVWARAGSMSSLFVSPSPERPVPYQSGSLTARVACMDWGGDAGETAYFGFRELREPGATIRTDRVCDLTIRGAMAKQWLVMGPTAAKITYQPRGGKLLTIDAKPGQTYELPEAK